MKEQLIEYLQNSPESNNYNKSSTRYLYLKHPELWEWVLNTTSFLPDDAKPKQRVWHILNDNFERPVCPVKKVFVKWWENRYLVYSSQSAKALSKDNTKKRLDTYKEKTGFDHWNSIKNENGYNKRKDTCFANWGGVWPNATLDIYNKFIETKITNGNCRTEDEKELIEIYYGEVGLFTKDSWYYSYNRINPTNLTRGKEYHLDHIFSRREGFDNDISPKIIGHWTNLILLPAKDNNGKGPKCNKTIYELYTDYYNNGGVFDDMMYKYNIDIER